MRVHSSDWTQFDMYGMTDAWSADGRPVGVRFMVYDETTREAVYSSGVYSSADGYDVTFDSADDPELARYLSGTLRLHGYVSGLNGRWVTEVEYDTHTEIPSPTSPEGTWARYNIALEFSAEPGVHVDVTSDAQYSRLASWPGNKGPDASLSVIQMLHLGAQTVGRAVNGGEINLLAKPRHRHKMTPHLGGRRPVHSLEKRFAPRTPRIGQILGRRLT